MYILANGKLITRDEAVPYLPDGGVAIDGTKIAAVLDAVQVQRVGAGLGALQGQVAVDVPPLAVQDLIEIGGVEAIDAQSTGQGGVDMGMGVHQPRHNDAALGINELRVRVLGLHGPSKKRCLSSNRTNQPGNFCDPS